MPKEGISVSFRLHPSDDRERQAIEIIQDLQSRGYSTREIMTDALLRASGYTPEMFRGTSEKLTPSLLHDILAEFASDILSKIKLGGGAVVQANDSAKPSPFGDDDEDSEMARNLAAGWMSRNKRK